MYLIDALKAVRDHIEYDRMANGKWRAAFKGAFEVSAEARSPDDARLEVETEIAKLVAEWIVRPPGPPSVPSAPGPRTNVRRRSTGAGRRSVP
jgi:hypothetical protein